MFSLPWGSGVFIFGVGTLSLLPPSGALAQFDSGSEEVRQLH